MVCESGQMYSVFLARYVLHLLALFDIKQQHLLIVASRHEKFSLVIEVERSNVHVITVAIIWDLLFGLISTWTSLCNVGHHTLAGRYCLTTSFTFCCEELEAMLSIA